jgi:tRNA dimethylallyltransferase
VCALSEYVAQALPVLVIFAPTACGKTDLLRALFSVSAHSPFAGMAEIISADSMQVYRGMDIGTAKPDTALLRELPHHLIDMCAPFVQFSVADFVRQADLCAQEISSRGKLPVVAGGAGFYIRNFLYGLPCTPEASDTTRSLLQSRLHSEGAEVLHGELIKLDPVSAAKIHKNDGYRILRALEVCADGGKPLSSYSLGVSLRSEYDFCVVILERERDDLYRRIDNRVNQMFADGLVAEVQSLIDSGYTENDPGMQAIGYREFFLPEIRQITDPEERNAACLKRIQRDTRRYAKRQCTFIKGIPSAENFHADDFEGISKLLMRKMNKSCEKPCAGLDEVSIL